MASIQCLKKAINREVPLKKKRELRKRKRKKKKNRENWKKEGFRKNYSKKLDHSSKKRQREFL
jgi:hypothetical protein